MKNDIHEYKVKIIFCAVNEPGYYSLPIRILSLLIQKRHLSKEFDTRYIEWENHVSDSVFDDHIKAITKHKPDILGLSVNIWNRNTLFKVAKKIKKAIPGICVLAGGQEVTRSVTNYLELYPELDYIIDGDGEIPIEEFLTNWNAKKRTLEQPHKVSGLWYREKKRTLFSGPAREIESLNQIPSPILNDLVPVHEKNRLGVLLETTRGCPFRCSYCFEGSRKKIIQSQDLTRLEQEVNHMASQGANMFHILDPILCNSKISRLKNISKIFKEAKRKYPAISVAVEGYGEQITPETIQYMDFCTTMDIGLQSINPNTVKAIHRSFESSRFEKGINLLHKTDIFFNIYLICGLPFESLTNFFRGVLFALHQNPPGIFINALYLLNGTELRKKAHEYGYLFNDEPPYNVYANKWMSQSELLLANKVSDIIAGRHNLSFLKFKIHGLPWVKGLKSRSIGKVTINMNNEALQPELISRSYYYSDVVATDNLFDKITNPEADPKYINHHFLQDNLQTALNQVFNHDVELICDCKMDIRLLCMTASQCQLAGATRINLTAPIRFLEQVKDLEELANSGIWHYKFYVDENFENQANFEDDVDFENSTIIKHSANFENDTNLEHNVNMEKEVKFEINGKCNKILAPSAVSYMLKKRYKLNMPVNIKPFTELVFTDIKSGTTIDTAREAIETWGNTAQILSFPNLYPTTDMIQQLKKLFFSSLKEYSCYIKLPEQTISTLIDEIPDKESVLYYLKTFV
ncbi:hypothetical protein MTBBW1_50057 [Desulfamplus magnetovallimortis]|uniref:Uncharacterized protein n=1 Tax=Desulfamplus magnetovallimortis TaxID=1246637 RepID=A0A1W1HHH3_9BACT|nr:radical SAM protein [Desulfamplus magnetovallimortis]SLM31934.1 hypothetical protein MTBBW1_50057 [Desulfamplus magnetovallimortis]